MPAIAPPPNAPWPGPGRPSPGPVLHPAARPRDHRRKLPVVVFLGMVLGLLGVAAIGVVIFLVVTPRKGANLVPSLMLTPSLPSASMSAVPVEPLPEVTPDGGDGLPSLDAGWGIRRRKGRAR
jgi:hypothetical protein